MENRSENVEIAIAEAEAAYGNAHVEKALSSVDWFTTRYIIDVHDHEPEPERPGLGPFDDKALGNFFEKGYHLGKGNESFLGVSNYVSQRMIGSQGHPVSIGKIPFSDQEFLKFAASLGVDSDHQVMRDMTQETTWHLQSLVAPEWLRRKVIRVNAQWDEGYEQRKRDVLLWAELVKRGAKQFIVLRQSGIK